jgi:outer membrane protein TolC
MKIKILTAGLLAIAGISRAQSPAPGLNELIDSALHKDYDLANQRLDIGKSRVDQQKLAESYLPRVNISAVDAFIFSSFSIKSSEIDIPQLNINIKEGRNRFTTTSMLATADANASMLLYSGGKIPRLKKALTAKITAQTEVMEKDRQEIMSNVMAAYDQLALLRQVRLVLDESARRLAEDKRTSDKALGYGLITNYEHQKIEVAQAQLASRIEDYKGKRELVEEQLYLLTNIDRARISLIDDSLRAIAAIPGVSDIGGRAEMRALDAVILAARYNLSAEKTWFVPKVQAASSLGYLGLLAGHISSSDPILPGGSKLSAGIPNLNILPVFNIGVGVKWDVFDGKQMRRDVQKAELEVRMRENDKKQTAEQLELNLAKSRSDHSTALGKLTLLKTQRRTAVNALTQAMQEYRTGLIRTSQLIEAEEDFENAELGYIQAIYNQRRTAIALFQATGNLTLQAIQ